MAINIEARADEFRKTFERIRSEIRKTIVGHDEVVLGVLECVFSGGNCLLEGVPGLGKTMLVRTLSTVLDLEFSRIQFTPDLMPADIIGTTIVSESEDGRHRDFQFRKGPVFAQIILADEINRATPKTQSAMLEAMQEHSVTRGEKTFILPEPFFVLATQNPLEMEGTYPLPEAQLDRFMYKINVDYSSREELREVLTRTTEGYRPEITKIVGSQEIIDMQSLARDVIAASHVKDYIVRLVMASHPGGAFAGETANKYLRFGASPRAAQAIALAGKVKALIDGRFHVSFDDVRSAATNALRHRIILNFEAEASGVRPDDIVRDIIAGTPTEVDDFAPVG
jgi:MoxR-like ATPase